MAARNVNSASISCDTDLPISTILSSRLEPRHLSNIHTAHTRRKADRLLSLPTVSFPAIAVFSSFFSIRMISFRVICSKFSSTAMFAPSIFAELRKETEFRFYLLHTKRFITCFAPFSVSSPSSLSQSDHPRTLVFPIRYTPEGCYQR